MDAGDPLEWGQEEPPRPSRRWIWILGLLLAGVVATCCLAGFAVFLLGKAGVNEFSRQVRTELEDNAVLREHVGTIESFECDFSASMEEEDELTYVFDVEGTQGSGRVIARCVTVDADREEVTAARLVLPDGRELDLAP